MADVLTFPMFDRRNADKGASSRTKEKCCICSCLKKQEKTKFSRLKIFSDGAFKLENDENDARKEER